MMNGTAETIKTPRRIVASLEQQFAIKRLLSRMVREGKIIKRPDGRYEYTGTHNDDTVAKVVDPNLSEHHVKTVRVAMKMEMVGRRTEVFRARASDRMKSYWGLEDRVVKLERLITKLMSELGIAED